MTSIETTVREVLHQRRISHPPVDVFQIIRSYDIHLLEVEMESDVSGVLDLRDSRVPRIVVNSKHHLHRRRFSAGHEFGHYLLHAKSGLHVDKQTFFRNSDSATGLYKTEIEANRFAAELLMPKRFLAQALHGVSDRIDSDEDVVLPIAEKFGVSTTAMTFKIQGLLTEMGYPSF